MGGIRIRSQVALAMALAFIAPPALAGGNLITAPDASTDPLSAARAGLAAFAALEPDASANARLALSALDVAPSMGRDAAAALAGASALASPSAASAFAATVGLLEAPKSGQLHDRLLATLAAARLVDGRSASTTLSTSSVMDAQGAASSALRELHVASGLAPPASELANALDAMPVAAQGALARVVRAHLDQAARTRDALAPTVWGAPPDIAALADARDLVALAMAREAHALAEVSGGPTATACGAYALDLAGVDSTHTCVVSLLIDVGGDDTYFNNAGGASGNPVFVEFEPKGPIVNDPSWFSKIKESCTVGVTQPDWRDRCRDGVLGPCKYADACPGQVNLDCGDSSTCQRFAAALLDLSGNDTYAGGPGAGHAGGARFGSAALLDLAGRDRYVGALTQSGAANGAGSFGAGLLLDAGEDDDEYAPTLPDGAANGAASLGSGLLLDLGGNDRYAPILAAGVANGAASGGVGVLVDANGDDAYFANATSGALNGAATSGIGILVDGDGDDHYEASVRDAGAANGAAVTGTGVLVDLAGTNDFDARVPTVGGAAMGAATGRVAFTANANSSSGGAAGQQVDTVFSPLVDLAPNAAEPLRSSVHNETKRDRPAYYPGGAGVLVAGPGDDTFVGNGTTQGAAAEGALGILVDLGGANSFRAIADSLAQGAGRNQSLGLLRDGGHDSTYTLDERAAGQGAGLAGAGILLHDTRAQLGLPIEDSTARFIVDASSAPSARAGSGTGLNLDLGVTLQGSAAKIDCVGLERRVYRDNLLAYFWYTSDPEPRMDVTICLPPEDDEGERVNVPLTNASVPDAPKPRCSELDAMGVPCATLMDLPVVTDGMREWMEYDDVSSTIQGGFAFVQNRTVDVPYPYSFTVYSLTMYDRTCRFGCDAAPGL